MAESLDQVLTARQETASTPRWPTTPPGNEREPASGAAAAARAAPEAL